MGNVATSPDYVNGQCVPPVDYVMGGALRPLGVQPVILESHGI